MHKGENKKAANVEIRWYNNTNIYIVKKRNENVSKMTGIVDRTNELESVQCTWSCLFYCHKWNGIIFVYMTHSASSQTKMK